MATASKPPHARGRAADDVRRPRDAPPSCSAGAEALPPVIAALTPAYGAQEKDSGYVTYVSLDVNGCDQSVKGTIDVFFPPELHAAQEGLEDVPDRVLAGAALSDPSVRILDTQPGYWNPSIPPPKQWDLRVPSKDEFFRGYPKGRAGLTRLDGWRNRKTSFKVRFEADWLHRRSYKTCWLSIPELVGPRQVALGTGTELSVERDIGSRGGNDPIQEGEFEVGGSSSLIGPDGSRSARPYRSFKHLNQHVSGQAPASVGTALLRTSLDLLQDQSQAERTPPGIPRWSCQPSPSSGAGFTGFDSDGSLSIDLAGSVESHRAVEEESGCAGWVALAEPGAASWRDAGLLVVGALISLAAALFVELVLARERRAPVVPDGVSG